MNELRDEIELPPIEDTFGLGMVPPMEALRQREAQLKSSLAANREQKAEIERLKACTQLHNDSAVEAWQLTQKWQKRVFDLEAEKRASVGEKPEDAWGRGQQVMLNRVLSILQEGHGEDLNLALMKYVAPTLPGEEK